MRPGLFKPENRNWGAYPPRVWLDAPRVQPFLAPRWPEELELFHAVAVFREGAENCARGACAHHLNSGSRAKLIISLLWLSSVLAPAAITPEQAKTLPAPADHPINFSKEIKPI